MVATHISAPDYPTQSSDSLDEAEKASLFTTYEQTLCLKPIFFKLCERRRRKKKNIEEEDRVTPYAVSTKHIGSIKL